MAEKNDGVLRFRTAWHPMMVFTMEQVAPADRKILYEFSLNRLPQRVDIVIIEQKDVPAKPPHKLLSIFGHLQKHNLIEYKGTTDDLEAADLLTLLAYAAQYMVMHGMLDPAEICLMVLADSIPGSFVKQVERMEGSFAAVGSGLWRGRLCGFTLHGVELREACKHGPSERLLYLFTREFLKDPRALFRWNELDEEDIRVYRLLCRHVQQFRSNPMTIDSKDLDVVTERLEKPYMKLLDDLTPEQRLAGLKPEQILAGLKPEQILAGLKPEQRLAGLKPEQRLAGLKPEQIIEALPPEVLEAIRRMKS
jgi:hypothetical protein